MVYPVNNIKFKVGTKGINSEEKDMCIVKDMESFSISFNNGIEEWNSIDQGGWTRRLITSKSISISISGKRNYNDIGNNYIASLAYKNGDDACTKLEIIFPDGSKLKMDCVINVSNSDGGQANSILVLEFDCLSNGRPSYERA